MRKRTLWYAALTWPLLVFSLVAGLQAPLIARPVQTSKPLRTWSAPVSWYGPGFQGHKTASGEDYNMFSSTAAHPWLPFGSLVRVVNLRTGKARVVRINDRGPFTDDRELDVSFEAATRLGLLDGGIGHFRLELLHVPSAPNTSGHN